MDSIQDTTWDAEEVACQLSLALPRISWSTICKTIRAVRDAFLLAHEQALKNKEASRSPESCPAADAQPEQAAPPKTPRELLDWGAQFLPEHFSKPPSAMHRWMAQRLDAMSAERGTKLNVLGPRGGAKSTLATLAYPLRAALEATEPYIWIVSDTKAQAHAHLENLKLELIDNPRIAQAYPAAAGRGPVWRAGRIVMRNGVTLEAFGTGQRIAGRAARTGPR